jgi:hypothetical protein
MYWYGVKYGREITPYSPYFDSEEEMVLWYEKKGKRLIEMFNRELIPMYLNMNIQDKFKI